MMKEEPLVVFGASTVLSYDGGTANIVLKSNL